VTLFVPGGVSVATPASFDQSEVPPAELMRARYV
jgi:hypothetical protein